MPMPSNVKVSENYPIPEKMKAWVLGDPGKISLEEKAIPVPNRAEVLVRIDAVAICATDLEIIHHGPPAQINGGKPFNQNFTPFGHYHNFGDYLPSPFAESRCDYRHANRHGTCCDIWQFCAHGYHIDSNDYCNFPDSYWLGGGLCTAYGQSN